MSVFEQQYKHVVITRYGARRKLARAQGFTPYDMIIYFPIIGISKYAGQLYVKKQVIQEINR